MLRNKLLDINDTNISLKKCLPHAKIKVYYEDEKKRDKIVKTNKNKTTLTILSKRIDRLESTITNLAKVVQDGFKQVNARINRIDTRLDYIVKANNLKDLSNRK